jgi:hypothetical protein
MKTTAAALLVITSMTAQAAEPATLTLACKGTVIDATQDDAKPEPLSMGIIINFAPGVVHGFGFPVKITAVNEVTVSFGSRADNDSNWSITGSIDRVTGDVWAMRIVTNEKTGKTVTATNYSLKCRPAQRMF